MVAVELTAVVELLTGFQLFPSSQLGLVDTQVPVWVGGAGLAVGDGEIRVQDIPNPMVRVEDNFLRTDFNEDFRVLDKALALKPEILSGSYTGDDARSRDISLGVSPRAVFVVRQDGAMQSDMYTYGGLALQGAPVTMRDGNLVEITSSGIRVARGDLIEGRFYADANRSGMSYYYIAFH